VKTLLAASVAAAVALLAALLGGPSEQEARPAAGAAALTLARPASPAAYKVPRHARHIESAAELRAALADSRRTTLVLAPGRYGGRAPFQNSHGHRIYSARPGRAVLRAGLSIGGNFGRGGALVRGLTIDVADRARTVDGAAIAVWGVARDTRILDVTLRGHSTAAAGISARRPDGLVVRRVRARGFTDYGVFADANDTSRGVMRDRALIEDVDVARVARARPGSSQGRAEACVWVGNTAVVRRVRARRCAWTGLWTGTAAHRATFDQIDVDGTRTGVYVEHFTHDSRFRRLRVGPDVRIGLTAEWDDPAWGGRPASVGNVIEDSRFDSRVAGVYLDAGTTRTTIRRSSFIHQSWAAIGDYRGDGNAAYGNDYSRVDPGAPPVRTDHLSTAREG
jgi:hypothetical protein